MGSCIELGGQIHAGAVQNLVPTLLPQETEGDVVDPAVVSNISRGAIAAVVLGEFLLCQTLHHQAQGYGGKRMGRP